MSTVNESPLAQTLAPVLAEVASVAELVWRQGWAEASAGNLSYDVTDRLASAGRPASAGDASLIGAASYPALAGRWLLVTATGARFGDLASHPEAELLLLHGDPSGQLARLTAGFGRPDSRPTSELVCHLKIQAALRREGRPERAVLHAHPTHLIAASHLAADAEALSRILAGALPELGRLLPEGLGLVAYRPPGSPELAEASAAAVVERQVVVWAQHGCLAVGQDLPAAMDALEVAEKAAAVYLGLRTAGGTPPTLGP